MNAPLTTEDVTVFSAAAEWTGTHASDRLRWLKARSELVTASEIAAVMNEDPRKDKDALNLYVEKLLDPAELDQKLAFDDPRRWGLVFERPIFEEAAAYYGWEKRDGGYLLRSKAFPHVGATLDGEIRVDGEWRTYEGKTVNIFRYQDWEPDEGDPRPPRHYMLQKQSQLLVTGADVGIIFALIGGHKPLKVEIQARKDLHTIMIDEAGEFLERLKRLDPPPATWKSESGLRLLFPEDDGSTVPLPPEAVEWTRELFAIAGERKVLETREKTLKNELRKCMGSATYGALPMEVEGRQLWKNALQARAAHAIGESESRTLKAVKGIAKAKRRRARR